MPVREQFPSQEEFEKALRDWFAGQALLMFRPAEGWPATVDAEEVARRSYAYADAMLAERAKP